MLSIIVPSYNRKGEVTALLQSLTYQTRFNFEVVIVDDNSVEPVEITQDYPFTVTLVRNQANKGAAESRNIGVAAAQYDWLLFLDDDDRFTNEKCEVVEQAILSNERINFIYHPAQCEMVNEGFSYLTHPYADTAQLTLENILKANKIGGMPMLAVKKSFFQKLNGLSTDLLSLEDYDFVLKAITDPTFSPLYLPQALTKCTFHTKRSSVSTNNTNTEQAILKIKQKFVRTPEQAENFQLNSLYMLAFPYAMNLSRKAAKYYFELFKHSKNIKYLAIMIITLISPKLAINIKRFI
ncbi:glycosyltransferase family 2 protein [Otariodibacter oris]|uniref:Glycosyl transferase family 2 n=1 Tax=Otariodibacter oris TaxID=1032623 RepID=A0A420XHB4_9PAST|nr:glycosyltransferase [Otariodibacter oris]QGM81061.1 glycosyltransferase [Otariodibacter oris]RKR76752.1 glycosyl transferase family 2 [Otariodibacter oris]